MAVIITNEGVREVTDREFFESFFGHPPRTQEQRKVEWEAEVERYAAMILSGGEWAVPPPYLYDARKLLALRDADSTIGDPLKRARRAA